VQIGVGFELIYDLPQATPMLLTANIHHSRSADLIVPDRLVANPAVPITGYSDRFGNWISRLIAPGDQVRFSAHAVVRDTGQPDPVCTEAAQHGVHDLPEETLLFLLGSRYCETDLLSPIAWNLFGRSPTGWGRVQAICDFVRNHLKFGYEYARPTK
jgi:transglutaminase-like putative cysteine protease